MTLREDVQIKLQRCNPTLGAIAADLHRNYDLAAAAKQAQEFKSNTLALIGSLIEARRTELQKTMEAKQFAKLSPEDFLLKKVIVTRQLLSIFQTAMHRNPSHAENDRIIEPMACAQQLLQTALQQLPPDEEAPDALMDSTDEFVVE